MQMGFMYVDKMELLLKAFKTFRNRKLMCVCTISYHMMIRWVGAYNHNLKYEARNLVLIGEEWCHDKLSLVGGYVEFNTFAFKLFRFTTSTHETAT